MKIQNYQNHKQYVAGYHFFAFSLVLILLVMSAYNMYVSFKNNFDIRVSIMFFITSVLLILLFFYSRIFALRAHDRAIKAEESLRCYMLTGKAIDSKLNPAQIVALRFAPDEEFTELYEKTLAQGLSSNDIKKSIINWKSDLHRV